MKKKKKYIELTYLKGRITERNETYRTISQKTGIPLNSLSNKINGYSLFDIQQVAILCDVLDIAATDIPKFFMSAYCVSQQYSA